MQFCRQHNHCILHNKHCANITTRTNRCRMMKALVMIQTIWIIYMCDIRTVIKLTECSESSFHPTKLSVTSYESNRCTYNRTEVWMQTALLSLTSADAYRCLHHCPYCNDIHSPDNNLLVSHKVRQQQQNLGSSVGCSSHLPQQVYSQWSATWPNMVGPAEMIVNALV